MTQPSYQPSPAQAEVARQPTAEAEKDAVSPADVSVAGRQSAERVSRAVADQLVSSRAIARPVAVIPEGPRHSPTAAGEDHPIENGAEPAALLGRHHRLHIGWHSTSLAGVAKLGRPTSATGLLLGMDSLKRPVAVRFFRAEPTRVTLVGGVWAAQLLAMRALAMGANVAAMTIEPQVWAGFRERVISPTSRLVVLQGEQSGRTAGTIRQPVLVIYDLDTSGPIAPLTIGPWQTHLVILRRLSVSGMTAVQQCDLLITQRLQPAEAENVQSVLRINNRDTGLLQHLEDEMLALIGGGADRYVWLRQTSVERQVLGPACR
jgi:hypothetical protein